MLFRVCQEARLEALKYAQNALFRYLEKETAFFCPQLAKLLVANIRECLYNFKRAGMKKVQLRGPIGSLYESDVSDLLRQTQITSRFLTRSKRAESFNRMLKLLTQDQRAIVRRKEISLLEIDIAWRSSPKTPLSADALESLLQKDARRVAQQGGAPVALANQHNVLYDQIKRDRKNVEESIKKE